MEKIHEFINRSLISEQTVRHERIFLTEEQNRNSGIDATYFVKEVIDPVISIRREDLNQALEMARRLGVSQGQELITIE